MPSGLSHAIAPEELAEIVASAFESMLGLEMRSCGRAWLAGGDRVMAVLPLGGNWRGTVLLECDAGLACQLAGRFLSIPPAVAIDDLVRDVLGELVNMIGGNLKCVLAQGVQLSPPSVLQGSARTGQDEEWLGFECAYGPLWATVRSADC